MDVWANVVSVVLAALIGACAGGFAGWLIADAVDRRRRVADVVQR